MSDYFILSFTKKLLGMLEASYDTRRLPTPVTRETLMYHIELSKNKVGIKANRLLLSDPTFDISGYRISE